ncbi:MltA domain-containing protein [Chamaesiphon sp. GL140_3_metabinner_50]|uniref:murein transglycosylase A n=1 Tax=Chamaesiphon sp. GL140_3_metabinner_50 TaxID=2970812 RepID=UPI0025DD7E47|nr:MltA domain-containing protein [Chamaesiphon sp. GL140_3_metabinner_50]
MSEHHLTNYFMIKTLALLSLNLGIALGFNQQAPLRLTAEPAANIQADRGSSIYNDEASLGFDEQLWGKSGDKLAMVKSIDNSLRYLDTPAAIKAYQNYAVQGISRDRVRRSLVRFRQLVNTSTSAGELQAAVKKEFAFYQSIGNDNKGTVKFTGYYEPIYQASRQQTAEFKYPLYKLPANFSSWKDPQPERLMLEGADGLQGSKSSLAGNEIFWMRDRFEAILVQIQGSAELELTDSTKTTVGFAGGTNFAYSSIGKELAKDGKVTPSQLTLPGIIRYFQENPQELDVYIPRYKRFVFMKETFKGEAMGSINVPVTPDRSIATDKSMMPPGALALVYTELPYATTSGRSIQQKLVSRYVLDQDTGSAITGPGRVDYFMGTGKVAGDRAGVTGGPGQLYYLLLKS